MANDVYLLSIRGVMGGEYVENVLAYQSQAIGISTTPGPDAFALATAAQLALEASWLSCNSDAYQVSTWNARRVNNSGGQTFAVRSGNPGTLGDGVIAGAGPLITSPYYDSGAVKPRWRTTRLFVPGVAAGSIVQNVIQAGLAASLATFIGNLNASIIASGTSYIYGAWARKEKVFYSVGVSSVSVLIGTQRRRFKPSE